MHLMTSLGRMASQRLEALLRRAGLAAASLLLVIALAGCGTGLRHRLIGAAGSQDAQPFAVGTSAHVIIVGGLSRDYLVYRPAVLPARAPLVVMIHGGFGTASQAEKAYRWDHQADVSHFLVAYPDGLDRAWDTGGGCCGVPGRTGVNDVAFITAMVSAIERKVPVDPNRVYATGISNGGIMAYTLACRTRIFAAIGPDSATELGACPYPDQVSVIHVHGTADHNIPYHGGLGDGPGHIDGPAIPALNATWRRIDHCAAPVTRRTGVVTVSVATCPAGRAVELITIAGAGHQWPGAKRSLIAEKLLGLDPPSRALNATQVIWQFFAAHPRRQVPAVASPGGAWLSS